MSSNANKRFYEYSTDDLNKMIECLKKLADNKRLCAEIALDVAYHGTGFSDVSRVAEGYREDAAILNDIANVLTQLKKMRTGGRP